MARFHVRCSKEKCKVRRVLAMHPDSYQRVPKCVGCGGVKYRVIKNITKERGATTCMCGSFQWRGTIARATTIGPHRRGSPTCSYNIDGSLRGPDNDTDYDRIPMEGTYVRWVVWCPTLSAFAGTVTEGWRGFTAAILAQEVDRPEDIGDPALGGL